MQPETKDTKGKKKPVNAAKAAVETTHEGDKPVNTSKKRSNIEGYFSSGTGGDANNEAKRKKSCGKVYFRFGLIMVAGDTYITKRPEVLK